jgi:spermidine/putrescine transport system permease protein
MATPITEFAQAKTGPGNQSQTRHGVVTRLTGILFSGYALLFYLFLFSPIVLLVLFSFNQSRFPTHWTGFTFDWYKTLFANYALGQALKNSLIVTLTSTAIATVIGTMVAVAMERYRFRAKTVVDGALFLPIIIPDIAMAIMLLAFFVLVGMQLGLTTIIIAHVAFNISFVAVIVRARMASIDPNLAEAARDLYANEWKEFWRVTFPQLIPGILAGALFAFILSFDDYIISFFTSGPGSTTLPIRIYGMVRKGITPEINAASSLMLLASFLLVPLTLWLQRKGGDN